MVLVSTSNKRKLYSHLLQEGVFCCKKVNLLPYSRITSECTKEFKFPTYTASSWWDLLNPEDSLLKFSAGNGTTTSSLKRESTSSENTWDFPLMSSPTPTESIKLLKEKMKKVSKLKVKAEMKEEQEEEVAEEEAEAEEEEEPKNLMPKHKK